MLVFFNNMLGIFMYFFVSNFFRFLRFHTFNVLTRKHTFYLLNNIVKNECVQKILCLFIYTIDTIYLSVVNNATMSLQDHLTKLQKWFKLWRIKINEEKSTHVNLLYASSVAFLCQSITILFLKKIILNTFFFLCVFNCNWGEGRNYMSITSSRTQILNT